MKIIMIKAISDLFPLLKKIDYFFTADSPTVLISSKQIFVVPWIMIFVQSKAF